MASKYLIRKDKLFYPKVITDILFFFPPKLINYGLCLVHLRESWLKTISYMDQSSAETQASLDKIIRVL